MSAVEQAIILHKQDQFMMLYKPVHERLNRFVHSMVWNREDARDVIADTILKAFENFEKVEDHKAFIFYLFGIASRIIKQRSRRLRIWVPFNINDAEEIEDESADINHKMEIDLLYKAMSKLPKKQREAISLFEISGFSLAEIQEIQGGSLSGVKSRIVRAREELQKILEKDFSTKPEFYFNISFNKPALS